MNRRVAAVDIGTNSTRLLVLGDDGRELLRETAVTGLGRDFSDGSLHAASIGRTLDRLRAYRDAIDGYGVPIDPQHVRAVATSAARDARNRIDFFALVAEVLGIEPVLLSGEEEGRLSFAGATAGLLRTATVLDPALVHVPASSSVNDRLRPRLAPRARADLLSPSNLRIRPLDLVVDIGGGSTEFIVGVAGSEPIGAVSVDAGSVRFFENYLREFDPPGPVALSAAMTVMRAHLDDVDRLLPDVRNATRLIGVAGTVTTVAAVEIGLHTYDRDRINHFVLTRAAVEDVLRTVATERREDRAANPGLSSDRVDTIVAGTLILATVMRHFEFDECLVSERDILDGVAESLQTSLPTDQ